jgi:hypothetical protein
VSGQVVWPHTHDHTCQPSPREERLGYYVLDGDGEAYGPVSEACWMAWRRWARRTHTPPPDLPPGVLARAGGGDWHVSTAFTTVDYRLGEPGPGPLVWETIALHDGDEDEQVWRWADRAQARAGHDAVVTIMRTGGGGP